MIHLTIALTTLRKEPRFELLVESLLLSANVYPMISWEFVCIDGIIWYDPHRSQKLADVVKGRFPYIHEPPKPTVWQGPTRLSSKDHWDACSARNTAFLYANGRQVVFIDDNIEVDENFLWYHMEGASKDIMIAGGFTIDKKASDHRLDLVKEPTFTFAGWGYGMNVSVPLHYAYKVNGYDEKYSGQAGVEDVDFTMRAERKGCKFLFNPLCVVNQHSKTHEDICRHGAQVTDPPKSLMLRDNKMHYANEILIQQLFDEPERTAPLGNDFSLYELRKTLRSGKPLPIPTKPEIDWRDGQYLKDM